MVPHYFIMRIIIEYGLAQMNTKEYKFIRNFAQYLGENLSNKGVKVKLFGKFNDKFKLETLLEKRILRMNSYSCDLIISLGFEKNSDEYNGAYAYAITDYEKTIAKSILDSLNDKFRNNGVREGKNKAILNKTIIPSIILAPFNIYSKSDMDTFTQMGIDNITKTLAENIISNL